MIGRLLRTTLPGFAALLILALQAVAQVPQSGLEHGFFQTLSFTGTHDNQLGWMTQVGGGIGYDVNRKLSVSTGVPFYLLSAVSKTRKQTGTEVTKQHYNTVGDVAMRIDFHPGFDAITWNTSIVGTAPTGNSSYGVSSGRATWNWDNRLEKDFSRLTPFVEATLGNTVASNKRYQRDYATLGLVSTQTAGLSLDLGRNISFESSAYEVTPFGDQKVYSRIGKNGKTKLVTSGSASLDKDHGFSGDLSLPVSRRLGFALAYTRSIPQALDSVSLSMNFRFGHIQPQAH